MSRQAKAIYVATYTYFRESLALRRELGDTWGVAGSLNNLGCVTTYMHNYAAALIYHQESLALRRELGDKPGIVMSYSNLGIVAVLQGDPTLARPYLRDAARLWCELGLEGLSAAVILVGTVAVMAAEANADIVAAARYCGVIEGQLAASGGVMEPLEQGVYDTAIAAIRAALDPRLFAAASNAGKGLDFASAFAELLGA